MEKLTDEMSLFDYLKRPAGPDLGKEVAAAAKKARIQPTTRNVKTKRYNGAILVYPKQFLDAFFLLNPDLNPDSYENITVL